MATGTTTLTIEEGVAILRLSNTPLNVISTSMIASMDSHLDAVLADPTVRALVVTGDGDQAFSAGSDISEFDDYMHPGQVVKLKLRKQNDVFDRLEALPLPTLAAVNGLAFGGGLEVALCCDFIVAARGSKFALPEFKLGVFPSSGGPVRLAKRIGPARAKQMVFTSSPVDAESALTIGLIDEVTQESNSVSKAAAKAREFVERPSFPLHAAKELINRSSTESWETLREVSFAFSDIAFSSPDCAEGVRAFRAKTNPHFSPIDVRRGSGDAK